MAVGAVDVDGSTILLISKQPNLEVKKHGAIALNTNSLGRISGDFKLTLEKTDESINWHDCQSTNWPRGQPD
jgi:hypothetical protein